MAVASWVRCQGWESESNCVLVNLGAHETHFPPNILRTSLRDMPEGEGLADQYFIDTKSKFKPVFSIHTARIGKANYYCLGMTGGMPPKLLQLMNPENCTPAALASSICL